MIVQIISHDARLFALDDSGKVYVLRCPDDGENYWQETKWKIR